MPLRKVGGFPAMGTCPRRPAVKGGGPRHRDGSVPGSAVLRRHPHRDGVRAHVQGPSWLSVEVVSASVVSGQVTEAPKCRSRSASPLPAQRRLPSPSSIPGPLGAASVAPATGFRSTMSRSRPRSCRMLRRQNALIQGSEIRVAPSARRSGRYHGPGGIRSFMAAV